jgi:3-oxocholest-4-en-26-oyl-CoA dehydrogenase alpha subunit
MDFSSVELSPDDRIHFPAGLAHWYLGGHLEVFRNMIAEHALGLGRPNYSPPRS